MVSGPARLRLVTGEVAAFRRIIELDERIAGFNRGSRLEKNLGDAPADLGIDRDLMDGGDRTDPGGEARNRLGLDFDGADLRGRRLVVREIGRDRLLAEPVETVKAAEHDRQQQPDDYQPEDCPRPACGGASDIAAVAQQSFCRYHSFAVHRRTPLMKRV